MKPFAQVLRELRQSKGLTIPELATRSGLHRQSIWQLEAGKTDPTWDTVCKLADALGVPSDSFREPAPQD